MLSKCANTLCNTPFRRLSEGKLFLVQGEAASDHDSADFRKRFPRQLEYFWLCDQCARLVTIPFNTKTGITTVPLPAGSPPAEVSADRMVGSERAGMLARTVGYLRD